MKKAFLAREYRGGAKMGGIYLLLPTFLIVLISVLVVRAGAIALVFTGMEESKARFQALSAFTRTGFTTREAETVMRDPRRRRIVTWLIIIGNAGLVTVIVTATSSLTSTTGPWLWINIAILGVGIYLIYLAAKRTPLLEMWQRFIEKRVKPSPFIEESAPEDLLHFGKGYGLLRIPIHQDSPLRGRSLAKVNAQGRAYWVMGIERGKTWFSLPTSKATIKEGDKLVVYGEMEDLKKIFGKPRAARRT
jgi:hypothetical protein